MNSDRVPRLVVDTNVWVSAIFWGGNPRKIIEAWIDGKIFLVISVDLRRELYQTVSKKAKMLKIFPEFAAEWLEIIDEKSVLVRPKEKVEICRDSKDNVLLEAAISGEANYLVTGDKDILVLKTFEGTKIVTPTEFLESSIIVIAEP
jgi:putative PIN family toxin of toxin-antitoxin system